MTKPMAPSRVCVNRDGEAFLHYGECDRCGTEADCLCMETETDTEINEGPSVCLDCIQQAFRARDLLNPRGRYARG